MIDAPTYKKVGIGLAALAVLLIIVLAIIKINIDEEGEFLCKLVEASPTVSLEECPAHNNPTSWYLMAAFAASVLILVAGVYLFFLQPRKGQVKDLKTNISKLGGEEATVYRLITSQDGMMYQSDIIKQMGLTKVKVSRILDRLEGQGIIERKRRGMTNVVVLK